MFEKGNTPRAMGSVPPASQGPPNGGKILRDYHSSKELLKVDPPIKGFTSDKEGKIKR